MSVMAVDGLTNPYHLSCSRPRRDRFGIYFDTMVVQFGPSAGPSSVARATVRDLAHVTHRCWTEARPVVQVVFLLRFLTGVAFAPEPSSTTRVLVAGIAWSCAAFSVYLFNGARDVDEDRQNGSDRPIARGDLSVRLADRVAAGGALAAVLMSFTVPGLTVWILPFLATGWAYSTPLLAAKRRSVASGAVVLVLGWTSYGAGVTAAGGALGASVAVFATVMSLWMALVGAIVKDFSDVEGDRGAGRRTVATRYGLLAARRAGAAGAALVAVAAPLAAWSFAPTDLPGVFPLVVGGCWVVALCLRRVDDRTGSQNRRRAAYRGFMTTQYAANIVMALALL